MKFFCAFFFTFAFVTLTSQEAAQPPPKASFFQTILHGVTEIVDFAKFLLNYDEASLTNREHRPAALQYSDVCGKDQYGYIEQNHYDSGMKLMQEKKYEKAYEVFSALWTFSTNVEQSGKQHCITLNHPLDLLYKVYESALKAKKYTVAKDTLYMLMQAPGDPLNINPKAAELIGEIDKQMTDETMLQVIEDFQSDDPKRQADGAKKLATIDAYKLCNDDISNEIMQRLAQQPQASCRYTDRNRHPLLILSPVKEEIYSTEPVAVFLHDLITKFDVETLKALGRERLESSRVEGHENSVEQTRKSRVGWLESKLFPRLTARLEAVLGMDTMEPGAESYQLAHYTTAGHYLPHFDHWGDQVRETEAGDRIATLLIYLSNITLGGRTIFPKLNLSVTPEARGAVFWYNNHRNETSDDRPLHAACPVLKGEKWAVNKWYRARGQLYHKPCALTVETPYTLEDFNLDAERREALFMEKARAHLRDYVPPLKVNLNLLDPSIIEQAIQQQVEVRDNSKIRNAA